MDYKIFKGQKKISLWLPVFIIASLLFSSPSATAADVSLDTSFDTDGKVTTAIGASNDLAYSMVLQSDGKIVVAGYSVIGGNADFALARYNTNGSLDTSFDTDGKLTTDFGGGGDVASSMVLQSDGKIVVAGYSAIGVNYDFALARYNTDGSLDTSFGTEGKVTTDFGASDDLASSMILQSDGKIVVAGYAFIEANANFVANFALARYNNNGSLDTSFGTEGKVTTAIGGGGDLASSMVLQSDGKIVVAGYSVIGAITSTHFALARYNTDGSLDTSFGTEGKLTTDFGASDDPAYSVILQSDGKIVVAGYSVIGGNADFALARYNTNGSLDTSFDTDGKLTTAIGASGDGASSMILQSDGKIVVAGYSAIGGNYDFALARYNTDGSLDTSFDTDGKVTTAIGFGDVASSMVLQSDGKIVVAGYSYTGGYADFALARYIVSNASEAAAEAARVAAAAEAARKAKEQKELTEILAIIPKIAELTLGLGETTKSLYSTKCVKGKTSKYVNMELSVLRGIERNSYLVIHFIICNTYPEGQRIEH